MENQTLISIVDFRKGNFLTPDQQDSIENSSLVFMIQPDGLVKVIDRSYDNINIEAIFIVPQTEAEFSIDKAQEHKKLREFDAPLSPSENYQIAMKKVYEALGTNKKTNRK